nr:hypothetical protein [Faustovirus mariensis]
MMNCSIITIQYSNLNPIKSYIHKMSKKCLSCDFIGLPPCWDLCEQCQYRVRDFIKPAILKFRGEYPDVLVDIHLCKEEGSLCIEVKYSKENLVYMRNKFCKLLGCEYNETAVIFDKYRLQITKWNGWTHEFGTDVWWKGPHGNDVVVHTTCLFISIKKIQQPKKLSELSVIHCAELGKLDGLTEDAIDQVLEFDHLLSIRYLF